MSKNGRVPICGLRGVTVSSMNRATRGRTSCTSSGSLEVDHVADTVILDSVCQPQYLPPVVKRTQAPGDLDATQLDRTALDRWIGDRLPGDGRPLTAERLGVVTGIANALYLLERGGHQWVLRRPPAVKNDPSASDTVREWRHPHGASRARRCRTPPPGCSARTPM